MTHGSLYSGIGGWLLAARWAGIENIFTVEIDEFCNKVLKKHFNVEQYRDIKEFDGTKYRGAIDIISTSDPCQPFSFAGKRGGKADDRFLWPQTIGIIREIKPSYVICENVFGIVNMELENYALSLEEEGYWVEPFVIPACAVKAKHRRNRSWIIAYTKGKHDRKSSFKQNERQIQKLGERIIKNSMAYPKRVIKETELHTWGVWGEDESCEATPSQVSEIQDPRRMVGDIHGISPRLDKRRSKALGNSIVPQIAYLIFEAIKQHEIHSANTKHNGEVRRGQETPIK